MRISNMESVRNLKGFNTVFSDSAFNFGARIISNIFYFLFITFIVKVLGEKRYGEYSVFLMVAQFIYIGFLVWLQSGLLRYGREELNEHNKINKIFTAHLAVVIPIIFLLVLIAVIFRNHILNYLRFEKIFLYIVIIYFIMNYLTEMLYYSLQALGEIKTMSVAQSMEKALPIFIMLAGHYAFGVSKLSFVVAVVLLSQLISQIFILIKIRLRVFFPLKFEKEVFVRYIKYSIPIFFGSFAAYFMSWIDVGIIKKTLSMEKVGHFFYCQQIYNGIGQISVVFFTILMPLVITLIVKKRTDLLRKIIEDLSLVMLTGLAIIINFMLFILYFVLASIFKTDILELTVTLKILLFSFIMGLNYKIMASYIMGYELTLIYTFTSIFSTVIKIALSLILINAIGIIGAAAATFLASFFSLCLFLYFTKKKISFNFKLNYFFIIIMTAQVFIYYFIGSIYFSVIINVFMIIIFIKKFKIFSMEKIKVINDINDMPLIIKKILPKVSKILG